MKKILHKRSLDIAFKRFFYTYYKVADKCSGTFALSIIQCVVMAVAVTKKDQLHGFQKWGLTFIAILSTVGFIASCFIIIDVVLRQKKCGIFLKAMIFLVFLPVPLGILFTAIATFKSL